MSWTPYQDIFIDGFFSLKKNACSDTFTDLLNDNSLSKLPAGSEMVVLGDFNNDFLAKKNNASFKLKRQLEQFAIANDQD